MHAYVQINLFIIDSRLVAGIPSASFSITKGLLQNTLENIATIHGFAVGSIRA